MPVQAVSRRDNTLATPKQIRFARNEKKEASASLVASTAEALRYDWRFESDTYWSSFADYVTDVDDEFTEEVEPRSIEGFGENINYRCHWSKNDNNGDKQFKGKQFEKHAHRLPVMNGAGH